MDSINPGAFNALALGPFRLVTGPLGPGLAARFRYIAYIHGMAFFNDTCFRLGPWIAYIAFIGPYHPTVRLVQIKLQQQRATEYIAP